MSKTFFISDLHLGHVNIVKYCNRPYKDVEEMNQGIINTWNSVVRPEDMVYVLGDVIMGHKEQTAPLVGLLCGHKHLIIGNHDEPKKLELLAPHFESMQHSLLTMIDGHDVLMTHIPFEVEGGSETRLHLCGHVHDEWVTNGVWINVGIDIWGKPVTLEEIKEEVFRQYIN